MGAADQAWADGLRQLHFPPERNVLRAHITLFHHLPPSQLPAIKALLSDLARAPRPPARVDRLIHLGRGVAFHVESPQLVEMRAMAADRMHGLLTPQDQAPARLHITIQNKVAPSEAWGLYNRLSTGFRERPLEIRGLAAWWYRGGPWEEIGQWALPGG